MLAFCQLIKVSNECSLQCLGCQPEKLQNIAETKSLLPFQLNHWLGKLKFPTHLFYGGDPYLAKWPKLKKNPGDVWAYLGPAISFKLDSDHWKQWDYIILIFNHLDEKEDRQISGRAHLSHVRRVIDQLREKKYSGKILLWSPFDARQIRWAPFYLDFCQQQDVYLWVQPVWGEFAVPEGEEDHLRYLAKNPRVIFDWSHFWLRQPQGSFQPLCADFFLNIPQSPREKLKYFGGQLLLAWQFYFKLRIQVESRQKIKKKIQATTQNWVKKVKAKYEKK